MHVCYAVLRAIYWVHVACADSTFMPRMLYDMKHRPQTHPIGTTDADTLGDRFFRSCHAFASNIAPIILSIVKSIYADVLS